MPKGPAYMDDDFSFSSEDDSDAPAEVSSSTVRKKKLSQVRELKQKEKETKEKEKNKRRKRDELFKSQKEKKLLHFGKRALPEDVLEAVSSKNSKLNEENDEGITKDTGEARLSESGTDDDDDAAADNDIAAFDGDSDFIALDSKANSKGLSVVTIDAPKKNKTSLDNALSFRNNQLFNSADMTSRRETANQRRNRNLKKQQLCGM